MSMHMRVRQVIPVDHLGSLKARMELSMKKLFLNVPGTKLGCRPSWIHVKVIIKLQLLNNMLIRFQISATFCQAVPFPPPDIGMVYTPDTKNNMSFTNGRRILSFIIFDFVSL